MLNPVTIPARSSRARLENDSENAVIVDLESAQRYETNEVGVFVWNLADGICNCAFLCDAVTDEFQVAKEIAQADLCAFIEEMVDRGLMTLREPELSAAG